MNRTWLKGFGLYLPAMGATAAMLLVIQTPIGWWPFAWIAYVPFLLVASLATNRRRLLLAAYIVGFLYWLGALYWVAPITIAGWLAFCAVTAVLWPILADCVRFCRQRRLPLVLAAPVLIVGIENFQGWPLGGFLWRFLAHSQFRQTAVIQIADVFGAAGVSFLIAMVSGLLADLLLTGGLFEPGTNRRPVTVGGRLLKPAPLCEMVLVIAAVSVTLIYGRWRIRQSETAVRPGPIVAAVQSCVPQYVKRSFQAEEEIFGPLLDDSRQAAAAGAELIVWPETMAQAFLDGDVWPRLVEEESGKSRKFDRLLREHARTGAYVVVGGFGGRIAPDRHGRDRLDQYNSAFLYHPQGFQDPNRYDKIHLVLFGEYLPFKKKWPWLYDKLLALTPYDFDYTLEPGTDFTIWRGQFPVRDPNQAPAGQRTTLRFGTIICYEASVPGIARGFAVDEKGDKTVDWLINISNDGWFVRFDEQGRRARPSAELPQHAAVCAFRAVENRVSILRSVNTGISCLIDSLGRIRDGYIASKPGFPARALQRKGMAGWFADGMPIDTRVTFFSKNGQWLDYGCMAAVAAALFWEPSGRILRRRLGKKPPRETR